MGATQAFDLVTDQWKENAAFVRRNRWMWIGSTALFGILFGATALFGVGNYLTGSAYLGLDLATSVVLFWFFLVCLFTAAFNFGDPPRLLRVTDEGLELEYPAGKVKFRLRWNDPKFSLLLRDFRGWTTPMKGAIVLDTGDHNLVRGLLLSRAPSSAFLTPTAFDAIIAAARERGLEIASRKETGWRASAGWMWPDTATRIERPGAQ